MASTDKQPKTLTQTQLDVQVSPSSVFAPDWLKMLAIKPLLVTYISDVLPRVRIAAFEQVTHYTDKTLRKVEMCN